jgi:UDP-N-acetylglucosamine enolpyruvyl transferase
MSSIRIEGGYKLSGEIKVEGVWAGTWQNNAFDIAEKY